MKTLKTTAFLVCGWLCAHMPAMAQEDVTSAYLDNPSFEADVAECTPSSSTAVSESADGLRGWNIAPAGWSATKPDKALLISADCFTDNNFGKTDIADGQLAYYQRNGWSAASSLLKQTTKAPLPTGEYELTFCTKAFYANSATSSVTIAVKDGAGQSLGETSVMCLPGSAGCMTSSAWKAGKVQFKVETEGAVSIEAAMTWVSGGSCIAFDNFALTRLPDGTITDIDISGGTEKEVTSPTEGVITHEFVDEATMQQDLLQMLANSLTYAKNIWYNCSATNSKNEECGFFKGNSAGNSNEDGVRTNADFSMICAFLYRYAQGKVTLPEGITWDEVKAMALKSLVFGYSTHKANKFKVTSNNAYWGSTSTSDNVWESSLWTMSLAYASYFLSDVLTETQKGYIYNMVKAECNYELYRSIPTGFKGDTKAEENGWETNVLACALGLYPNDELAPQWFARLREFAINCYSQADDANNATIIDPAYDNTAVKDLYKGRNLYDDYTLQNHNYFHTSYQNVVMQELGESHLALHLFQGQNPKWTTQALMHNNQKVMDEVLCRLALADGELAMPNGNDWSMFLYDQITSYTTAACFLRDPNALLLENMAYKHIKARQSTTADGSWLLNSDIGPRRMGVEGHRVMMTYLMHKLASTANLTPTSWDDFSKAHEEAYVFRSQNIVRANTPARFSVFSWSTGLGSYTGYFAPNTPDNNKIVVPFKANNTGNLLGWYTVSGKSTDASAAVNGIYQLSGNSYTMNGRLNTNGGTLQNSFTLYSTPGNALIYIDHVQGLASGTLSGRRGGLLAVSVDKFTKEQRTLYYAKGRRQTDGTDLFAFNGNWTNIDNQIGVVCTGQDNRMAFGDKALSNSIQVAKLYASYSSNAQSFAAGEVIDRRHIIYYSNVDSLTTAQLAAEVLPLDAALPAGWNGVIAADPDGTRYLLLSNYQGETSCTLNSISTSLGAPVFCQPTLIAQEGASATFPCDIDHSVAQPLHVFVQGADIVAQQLKTDSCAARLSNQGSNTLQPTVTIIAHGTQAKKEVTIPAGKTVVVRIKDGAIAVEDDTETEAEEDFYNVTSRFLQNPDFEEDKTYGTQGKVTLGSVTYDPCYINEVAAADNKWPQVLPIQGWTAGNALKGGSKYALLYSMPYSTSMYCVSPSNVGNSASIMATPAQYDETGQRCLSILNSWDTGSNAITQEVTLPAGSYKLKFLARYACANEMGHQAPDLINTTDDNVNHSLCGISVNGQTDYRYPLTPNNWEEVVIPFSLDETTKVTISLGLETSASQGAANNTRLYIDRVRLFSKDDIITSLADHTDPSSLTDVYNVQGIRVRTAVPSHQATQGLPKGVYVVGHNKVTVH